VEIVIVGSSPLPNLNTIAQIQIIIIIVSNVGKNFTSIIQFNFLLV